MGEDDRPVTTFNNTNCELPGLGWIFRRKSDSRTGPNGSGGLETQPMLGLVPDILDRVPVKFYR